MRIAIVGATGVVGGVVLELLSQGRWRDQEVVAVATGAGGPRDVAHGDRRLPVVTLDEADPAGVDYAFFAVPNDVAKVHVPRWREAGVRVIDKSSVWRMDPAVPLVVPEVNGEVLDGYADNLVANPNCSTTQLAVAAAPLARAFGLKAVRVATYQAVTGAGRGAVDAWRAETAGDLRGEGPFPAPMHENVIPAIGSVDEEGHFSEERKLMEELPKILAMPGLPVSATAVRVPVMVGHAEAVELELGREVARMDVLDALEEAGGVSLVLDPRAAPTPRDSAGRDDVLVGRVRMHHDRRDTVLMWVVSDNLRKGAATNALQILQRWEMARG